MGELWRELLFGLRHLRRSPGLAASVAVTVGLGVGANMAVLALLGDVFLPRTPYRDAGQLVVLENTGPYTFGGSLPQGLEDDRLSFPDFQDVEAGQRSLAAIGGFTEGIAVLTGGERPRAVSRVLVTPRLMDVVEVSPLQGRLFAPADFADGTAAPVALVTDDLWRTALGANPRVVGSLIRLDEQPFTVVGVIPSSTIALLMKRRGLLDEGLLDRCVVTPLLPGQAGESELILNYSRTQRDSPALRAVGRLRPGQTVQAAQADLAGLAARLREAHASTNAKRGVHAVALDRWRASEVRSLLWMLAAAAALAFFVACGNAAGLVLAKSVRDEPELAVRQALGAGPAQLLRLVLVRTVVWALPGALLGFVFATGTVALVRWGASAGAEQLGEVRFGPLVVGGGIILTLLAGVVIGGVAAWSLRRQGLVEALREGGPAASGGRRRHHITAVLVAMQVAAATTLAIGAALLVRSMWNVVTADRGFELDRGFVVQVRLPRSKYPSGTEHAAFYQKALARVRALPGVASAGVSASPPLTDTAVMLSGGLNVTTPGGRQVLERLNGQFVTNGYFEALRMRLVRGRFFSEADEQANAAVAVVDEAFSRAYLKGADPLASTLTFGSATLAIVGVVGDLRQATQRVPEGVRRSDVAGTAYLLYKRFWRPSPWSFLVVRAQGNPAPLTEAAVRELLMVDGRACLDEPRTFARLFARRLAERRRILSLVGGFALIVLLLTALSLTAALSQFVEGRARDIAIRFALGASRKSVLALTARHIGVAVVIGLAAGLGGAVLLARALSTQLYGMEATDATTLGAAGLALAALALAAAVGPLWRASRLSPALILRAE